MPRRHGSRVRDAAEKAKDARWRYLVRNPEFRRELEAVSDAEYAAWVARAESQGDAGALGRRAAELLQAFHKKWGFEYVRLELLLTFAYLRRGESHPVCSLLGLDKEEPDVAIAAFLDTAARVDWVISNAVSVVSDYDDPNRIVLDINLRHPVDVLVGLVEDVLRDAVRDRANHRRRLDKVDLYLMVFDLAAGGASFAKIAARVRVPVSTAKSAYWAAARNIFGDRVPGKADLLLSGFDPATHMETCTACRKAKSIEEFCPKARHWVDLDHKGQKELTGFDTVRDAPDHRSLPRLVKRRRPTAQD